MECIAGSQLVDLLTGSASSELALHVDAHVDGCADCRHLLENLARAISTPLQKLSQPEAAEPTPHEPFRTTESLGRRYRILGLLGEGGMGRVYRAFDRLLGAEVALKQVLITNPATDADAGTGEAVATLHSTFPSVPEGRATRRLFSAPREKGALGKAGLRVLAEEFRTLAPLRHPNIVKVLDYGFDANGQPFYTMELLRDARPLLDYALERTAAEKIELLVQLLYALAYLHRRGIVHRDLTPSNVLVVPSDEGPFVKVLDFGLAIDAEKGSVISVAGTLLYMAPELFHGEMASESSDLYAVGMIAYQMLTGRYPFQVAGGAAPLLREVLEASPDLTPLPPAMRPVLAQALGKSPKTRQTDAASLLRELAAAAEMPLKSEPVATRDSYLLGARFVGRHSEFEQLQRALDAGRHGFGSSWLLSGEIGVGKSRLLEELRSSALQAGVLTARGQAMAGAAAYSLWQDVLRLLSLQVPLSELEASVIGTLLPDLQTLLECEVSIPLSMDPPSARLRLFHILDEILLRLPETVLVLLEDLQWADSESLALLSHLISGAAARRLLIVATYRKDEAAGLARTLPQMRELQLSRFGRFEMEALCQSMLGRAGQDSQLLELVATETEGNAYFIVEAMRALAAEAGSLANIGQSELPQRIFAGGIDKVLERRLSRAPASAQPLLHLAAASGRELDLSLLSHLLPDAEVQAHELADVGLLELYMQRWRFSHDKLREKVCASLKPGERTKLHGRLAQSLEHLYPDDPGRASQIAFHYREAQEHSKAAHFYGLAGDSALRRGAPAEAAALLEKARGLSTQIKMPRLSEVRLWRGLTEARYGLGRLREAETAMRHLCILAGTPLPTESVRIWSLIARLAAELLGSRLGLSRSIPVQDAEQRAILAELLAGLGVQEVFVWTDQPELGILCTLFGMALEDRLGMAPQRNYHRTALFFILSHTPLRRLCLRYIEHMERHNKTLLSGTHAEIDFLRVRALVEINDGQFERAAEHAAQAVTLARLYKDDLALLHSLLELQLAAAGLYDFAKMLAVSQEMEPLAIRTDNPRYLALAYIGQGAAQLNVGGYAEAAGLLEKARAYLPQELGPIPESVTLGLLADCARHLRQFDRALELADQALGAVLRARWNLIQLRHPLVCVLDVYLNSPNSERHAAQIETALARLHRLARQFPKVAPDDQMYHGLYFWRFGQPRRSLRSFRKSIELSTKYQMPLERAMAQYWLGCFAQSPAGHGLVREGAGPHLHVALVTFQRLGTSGLESYTRAAMESSS